MNHSIAGCASTARSTFPTFARRTIFRQWDPGGWRTLLDVPLRRQGELIGVPERTSHRGSPLYPGADQASETFADQAVIAIENVRLFKELTGVLGAADRDE